MLFALLNAMPCVVRVYGEYWVNDYVCQLGCSTHARILAYLWRRSVGIGVVAMVLGINVSSLFGKEQEEKAAKKSDGLTSDLSTCAGITCAQTIGMEEGLRTEHFIRCLRFGYKQHVSQCSYSYIRGKKWYEKDLRPIIIPCIISLGL